MMVLGPKLVGAFSVFLCVNFINVIYIYAVVGVIIEDDSVFESL